MDRAVMIEAAQYLRQWLEEKGEVRPGPELH
jgi:hypothetical protein